VRTLVLSFVLKYGSSSVVSLLLRTTPVFLKSPRHVLYFLAALGLVQVFPGDAPFRFLQRSAMMQLVLGLAVAVYKVRKLLFVVESFVAPAALYRSWLPMLGLSLVSLDGGGLARRLENVLTNRGVRTSSPKRLIGELSLAFHFLWGRSSGLLLCASSLHLTANTARALAGHRLEALAGGLHLAIQAAALLVFLERAGVVKAKPSEGLLFQVAFAKQKAD